MDELNLQEIEKKLNTEYQKGQRIVFWYDAEASFEEEVDQLNLPDVQIVHLTDRNAFRVKLLLEHEEPEKKFLVYLYYAVFSYFTCGYSGWHGRTAAA